MDPLHSVAMYFLSSLVSGNWNCSLFGLLLLWVINLVYYCNICWVGYPDAGPPRRGPAPMPPQGEYGPEGYDDGYDRPPAGHPMGGPPDHYDPYRQDGPPPPGRYPQPPARFPGPGPRVKNTRCCRLASCLSLALLF